jgi:homoserine trans-succinylase
MDALSLRLFFTPLIVMLLVLPGLIILLQPHVQLAQRLASNVQAVRPIALVVVEISPIWMQTHAWALAQLGFGVHPHLVLVNVVKVHVLLAQEDLQILAQLV